MTRKPGILIVEDEFIIANDIRHSLDQMGYHVCSIVSSGEEVVERVAREEPDLILMDIMLRKGMDGIEAASEVCSQFKIPVVFLTSYADDDLILRAREASPFGYLIKPFDDRELNATIQMALDRAALEERLREREIQLTQAKDAAEAATRAKSRFLASMSHEIRTPLTAILGYSELLMSSEMPKEERQQHLQTICHNGESLLTIINDILDLSKIEAEKIDIDLKRCSPIDIVEDVRGLLENVAKTKGLELEVVHLFPLPRTVHTDPVRLRQILVNLVGNALKFTEEGVVKITLGIVEKGENCLRVVFTISDTGIGMNEEEISRIFQPFTQVHDTSTLRLGGTGLGLTISQKLAAMLGGCIEIESEPGAGSTFTLTIDPGSLVDVLMLESPDRSDTRMSESPLEVPNANLRGRILLVEDEESLQNLFFRFLAKTQVEVDLATDGFMALEMAADSIKEGRGYDLILLDIRMPKMDGYQVAEELRHRGWKGAIIAQTAYALTGTGRNV